MDKYDKDYLEFMDKKLIQQRRKALFACILAITTIMLSVSLIQSNINAKKDVKCFMEVYVNPGETLETIYGDVCSSYERTSSHNMDEWKQEVSFMNPIYENDTYEYTFIVVPYYIQLKDLDTNYSKGYYIQP